MKFLPALSLLFVTVLLAGCQSPPTPQLSSGSEASVAEGKIVTIEEGHLILKMPNGATEDFYFPNSEQMDRWIKPRLEYSDLPILSGGPACRVHFKSGSYENVEGEIVQVREITRFEWL